MNVQKLYEQYKDQGLEVLWVLGETKDKNAPTIEQVDAFVSDKQVTFPVLRDAFFGQVYGAMDPHANALPHQYILNGKTMVMEHRSGGINEESESKVLELLNAE